MKILSKMNNQKENEKAERIAKINKFSNHLIIFG